MNSRIARSQSGITLLEVLIAVLVLSIGLLGIAGLQTSALTNNFVSYQYTQAAILSQSMAERMRANRAGVLANNYKLAAGQAPAAAVNCSGSGAACASADQANWDMAVWYSEVSGTAITNAPQLDPATSSSSVTGALPKGAASISCPTTTSGAGATATTTVAVNSICTIAVYWDPNRTNSTTYTCDPTVSNGLRCFQLGFTP